ncbi:MAG: WcaI family glycosyltransferase, partial [Novosphingobium sp.]|nr:WcaI family glycosyltransferase [Novosphingobium sp.]
MPAPPRRATRRRLLLIGLNYDPEPLGIAPYTSAVAQALVGAGVAIDAIVAQPYYPTWRPWPGFGGWQRARENGVEVVRCPHYIPRDPNGIRRILHHVTFALAALAPALSRARRRPGAVLVIAPSLMAVPVGWLAARLSGARLWIHVQDFEVEASFATGLIRERSVLAKLALWVENRLLRSADLASTISPKMVERLIAKGVAAERVRELRNWASGSFAAGDPSGGAYRREWGLGDRKVALYSGNIANKQGLEVVIDAARRLRHRDDLVFVICGEGPNRARLMALADGLSNLQFHDLQPAERMGDLLALASMHLLPQIASAADLVLPSKLTNMLASGRPIVATAAKSSGLYDEVVGCGLAVPPGDGAAFAAAVAALADDPARCAELGEAGRLRAGERWGREALLSRFVAVAEAAMAVD